MKKFLSLFITMMMVIGMFTVTPIFAEDSEIIIHYQRTDNAYEDWNLWIWAEGGEGNVYEFEYEDDYGVVAVVHLPGDVTKAGFIVRTNDWDKDVSEDRFVELTNGFAEIWLMSGEVEFMTEAPANFLPFSANGSIDSNEEPSAATTEPLGDPEAVNVRIHYHRYDGDYTGWNLWVWPKDMEGAAYQFNETDDFGALADIMVPDASQVSSIGFIVRLNEWEAKDIDEDRYLSLSKTNADGSIDIYLVQADASIYYDLEEIDLSPKFLSAELGKMDTINIKVTLPFTEAEAVDLFTLKGEDGKTIDITTVYSTDGEWINTATLFLSEPVEIGKKYTLTSSVYGDINLAMNKVFDLPEFEEIYYYDGYDLGASYTNDQTKFRVWAPTASGVYLNLYVEGSGDTNYIEEPIPMTLDTNGTWVVTQSGDLNGVFYTYSVTVDEVTREAVDPYAKAVGINGNRGMVIDLTTTNPTNWANDKSPVLENITDAVIYELQLRDLSTHPNSGIKHVGKYLGLTETGTTNEEGLSTGLDHIKELGVTHIQLLPVFDFRSINEEKLEENVFNWGYDPKNYNAPEGSFSVDPYDGALRINEFKTMVQTLHDNGLGVIMDVVYNHTGATADSHLNSIVPNYYYRKFGDNFANGSGCGNETASERAMVRKMIVDSVVYWVNEYHIDGFRFDLMGLHDLETMAAVKEALHAINPSIMIYGEGWTGGTSPLPDEEKCLKVNAVYMDGIGVFSDDIRDGIKGSVFNETDPGFVNGATNMEDSIMFGIVGATANKQIRYSAVNYSNAFWANEPGQSINYAEAHDNHTLWDKLILTNPEDSDETRTKMHQLAGAIVLTSQGVPFIHAGMEFLRSKDGDHNSYQSPDSINQLDWSLKSKNLAVFEYYKGLIELRKAHPAFRMTTTAEIQDNLIFFKEDGPLVNNNDETVAYMITNHANNDEAGSILVFFNANRTSVNFDIPFGNWDVLVNGQKAGTEVLETISNGKLTVEPLSTMVLVSAETYSVEDDYGMLSKTIDLSEDESSTVDPVEPEEKKSPIGLIIGLIAGVGLVGGAGFLYFKKNLAK